MMIRLASWVARLLIGVISITPLPVVAHLGRFCSALVMVFLQGHRKVALKQLHDCFGNELDEAAIQKIAKEHFKRLGENFACAIRTAFMSSEQLGNHLTVDGIEKLTLESGCKNSILAVGHFGNFELHAHAAVWLKDGRPMTTYRSLKQPEFDRIMMEIRNRSKCLFLERRDGSRELTTRLAQGGYVLGLFIDQHAGRSGIQVPFFGKDCSTSPAPALFALRYHGQLHVQVCHRIGIGQWKIEISDAIPLKKANGKNRSVRDITEDINLAFEKVVRNDPPNWFWVHRRWKPLK